MREYRPRKEGGMGFHALSWRFEDLSWGINLIH
jgi:hypothetical protein